MNRSSSASGSGYVPSNSIGFCVANTVKLSGSSCEVPSTVTRRSCIASSSAACVLAGARLISSPRTRSPKIGPGRKLNAARPGQQAHARDVRRHEIGRELDAPELEPEREARVRTSRVLAVPGTPSSSTWPRASSAATASRTAAGWPSTTPRERLHQIGQRRPRARWPRRVAAESGRRSCRRELLPQRFDGVRREQDIVGARGAMGDER